MVISIRRSRHEEGEELVAIWCRSVDATHDFYQQSIGPSWKSWCIPFAGSTVVGRG